MTSLVTRWLQATTLAIASALAWPSFAADLCPAYTHTLAFFNGVWNTPDAAMTGARALSATLDEALVAGPGHAGIEVGAEVFYNASGLQRSTSGGIEDLVEVFQQRTAELDAALRQRWELFWEVVDGRQDWWRKIASVLPRAYAVATALTEARNARLIAQIASLGARPPTEVDYAAHLLRLRALLALGRSVLMVGHSQGNFFLNMAHRAVAGTAPTATAAVHIAPASSEASGPHLLSGNDTVIAALRGLIPGTPPPPNIWLVPSTADVTGHMLVETYLDSARSGRATAGRLMAAGLLGLRRAEPQASPGFFTATLAWDGEGDIDLHVMEPGGAHVHYGARIGASGMLDLDDTSGWGPEHYHATCDSDRLQPGLYSVGINNYDAPAGRKATVQIATADRGVVRTVRVDSGPRRGPAGDAAPLSLLGVNVAHTSDGWTATVH
ncbi:MAG: hypothetical protein QHC78_09295 [Pigmentiphaga sp.]|uniref:YfaP family protein n=1 Tax=Pigmentiphaga sp. TaxID=1977564 RepID=UPI0029BB5A51|nr:hypothetical protein [Pigmentiphaga sp.]MDX3905870.1 hypothetical protein [Pigmentiphaga sp.]